MEKIDPKWVRVSTILSMIPTQDSEGKWGYPMNNIDPDVLQRKADLGTAVHAAIAAHAKNEFLVVSDKEQGFVDSFCKWADDIKLAWKETEIRLYYEPMKLTGCIDMIGENESTGVYQIIDFKCTVAPDPVKWPLQGAFYSLLAQTNGITVDKRCLFVQLDPEGDFPKVHAYEITKDLTSAALSLYNTYMYLTRY